MRRCLEGIRKSPTTTTRFGGNKIKTLIARFAVATALDAKFRDAEEKTKRKPKRLNGRDEKYFRRIDRRLTPALPATQRGRGTAVPP